MIAQQIIEKALRTAQSAQVSCNMRETSEVNFENDHLKSAESSQRTDIKLRVILDGKVGVSTTTDPNDVDGVVQKALAAAQFGAEAHFILPGAQPTHAVKTYDPALLPRHGGKGMYGLAVHEAVLRAGDAESGVTVHFADEDYDHGPVAAQARVPVLPGDTPQRLAARVLEAEHDLYWRVVDDIANGRLA